MNDEMRITLSQVTKRFGERLVLDEVSLTINPAETVAIIGPSGAGKSTLLRCLNGLNPFDAGEIRIGSQVLRPTPPLHPTLSLRGREGRVRGTAGCNGTAARQVRRLLGMVFQDFQLFPHLTALQNIIEAPIHVLKLDKAAARDRGLRLLQRVGLADRADAYPCQLSGGQKQRVAIARALAMEPRGLLCDEITSALDPELKHEVLQVLEDLKRDGMTLLMVTHEIGFARRAADRVIVLADGKVIEEGPPSQVIDQPQAARTKGFLSRVLG
jgi:ABC-type polar amino acid transport system ATPase subunit